MVGFFDILGIGCDPRDLKCLRRKPTASVMYLRRPVPFHNQERPLGDVLLVS
jgi:hypothetical protein